MGISFTLRREANDFNARGHLVIGLLLAPFVVTSPVDVVLVLFGSLLPDIDHPNSLVGRWNLLNRIRVKKRVKRAAKRAKRVQIERLIVHRGKCHTIGGVILLSTPFFFVGGVLPFALVFYGAMSHLLGDKLYSWFPNKQKFQLKLW